MSGGLMGLYTVYDRVACQCGPLFEALNEAVAVRQYRNLLQSVSPLDRDAYVLYRVGSFDRDKMELGEFGDKSPCEVASATMIALPVEEN